MTVIAALLATVAGCVWSGPSSFHTLQRFYGGAVTIEPAPSTLVTTTTQRARFDLMHSVTEGPVHLRQQLFGYTTVRPTALTLWEIPSSQAPKTQLSWVFIYDTATDGTLSCSPGGVIEHLRIVDALTGRALDYSAKYGTSCTGLPRASLLYRVAQRTSVPWSETPDGRLQANLPGCTYSVTFSQFAVARGTQLEVIAERYIDACSKPNSVSVLRNPTTQGFPKPWTHGSLGVLPGGALEL